MRHTLRKIIPTYAILPLVTTGLMNLVTYQGAKFLQIFTGNANAIDMTAAWDGWFSFSPVWVLAYIGTFIFWTYQYTTVARESPEAACRLAVSDALAKLVCLVFFVALPTTNVRPEVPDSGVVPFLMRFIYWIDTPTNLFPSLHCCVSWLGTRYLFSCKKLRHKLPVCLACTVGSFLVFLSTLFTKQHVVWDVLSGVAMAEIAWFIVRVSPLARWYGKWNERFQETKLCGKL